MYCINCTRARITVGSVNVIHINFFFMFTCYHQGAGPWRRCPRSSNSCRGQNCAAHFHLKHLKWQYHKNFYSRFFHDSNLLVPLFNVHTLKYFHFYCRFRNKKKLQGDINIWTCSTIFLQFKEVVSGNFATVFLMIQDSWAKTFYVRVEFQDFKIFLSDFYC